jgi:hypothetical protein
LPKEVQVFDLWPASVRYVLPRRHLAGGWIFCGALLVAGLVEMGLLLHLLHAVLGGPHFIFGRAAAAILIVFGFLTLAGLLPLWWGLAGLFGHRELEITSERLRTIERVGPLWRSKRWKIAAIYAFDVVPITSGSSDEPDRAPPPAILEQFYALLVRLQGGKQGMLAWG